jgi:transcription initiation factor IIF auxiliary subunit
MALLDSPSAGEDIAVPPEVSCPLCLDLVHDPVSTPCRHVFCRLCISRVLSTGHVSCPLCRGDIRTFNADTAATDRAILALIAESVPAQVVARRARENHSCLQIVVGNLYEEVENRGTNSNKWTMYVTIRGTASQHAHKLIDRVEYKLHPTFRPSSVTAFAPNFGICRFGWGTFTVTCQIHWNSRLGVRPTDVDHDLVFENEGGRTTATVDVDPNVLERLMGAHAYGGNASAPARRALPAGRDPARLLSGRNSTASVARNRAPAAGNASAPSRREVRARTLSPEPVAPNRPAAQTGPSPRVTPDGWEQLEVVVGNRAEPIPGDINRCKWTLYVMLPGRRSQISQLIDHVDYELHPTFNPRTVSCHAPRFELSRIGWGTFPITCTIHWKAALRVHPSVLTHELTFNEGGAMTASVLAVRSCLLERLLAIRL